MNNGRHLQAYVTQRGAKLSFAKLATCFEVVAACLAMVAYSLTNLALRLLQVFSR